MPKELEFCPVTKLEVKEDFKVLEDDEIRKLKLVIE